MKYKIWPKGIFILFLEIATAKVEATTRAWLPNTHAHAHTHPSTQPLTWQHDIKSPVHREQTDGSTVHEVHQEDIRMYTYVSMYICTYVYVCTYVHMYLCMYICTYENMYMYVHVYICTNIHTNVHIHVHTYACMHACMIVYVCI